MTDQGDIRRNMKTNGFCSPVYYIVDIERTAIEAGRDSSETTEQPQLQSVPSIGACINACIYDVGVDGAG